jgi:hypothetical protein
MLAKELAEQASLKNRLPFAERISRHRIIASGAVCTPAAGKRKSRGFPGTRIVRPVPSVDKAFRALSSFHEQRRFCAAIT